MSVVVGSEEQVIADVEALGYVKETYLCFSVYDIVFKIEPNSMDELKDLLAHKYKNIKSVKSVLALLLIEEIFSSKLFLKYVLSDNLKEKKSKQEPLYDKKGIPNFVSSN